MNLIILGPQGSGKGTQADLLSEKFQLEHVDMGKALRQIAEQGGPLGKKIYEIQNIKKELVPGDIFRQILNLKLNSVDGEKGVILDGAPRKISQIPDVQETFLRHGRKINKVIYINIPQEESVQRISKRWMCENCKKPFIMGQDIHDFQDKCPACHSNIIQRLDDTPDGVKKRLSVFKKETVPVIEYFRKNGKTIEVSGLKSIDEVFNEIVNNLKDVVK